MRGPCWKVVTELQTWIYVCIIHEYLTIIKMQIIRETVKTKTSSIMFQDVSVREFYTSLSPYAPPSIFGELISNPGAKSGTMKDRVAPFCVCHTEAAA